MEGGREGGRDTGRAKSEERVRRASEPAYRPAKYSPGVAGSCLSDWDADTENVYGAVMCLHSDVITFGRLLEVWRESSANKLTNLRGVSGCQPAIAKNFIHGRHRPICLAWVDLLMYKLSFNLFSMVCVLMHDQPSRT